MSLLLFFFKQKTAYEMRISDWSSDVCSSDLDLDDALWDAILTVNLKSYFWMVKRCVPMMQAKGQGVIINTASVQGLQSQTGAAAYAASKGGIISMTRQLDVEYAEDNIRVVALAPGTLDKSLLRDVAGGIPGQGDMERVRQGYPVKP